MRGAQILTGQRTLIGSLNRGVQRRSMGSGGGEFQISKGHEAVGKAYMTFFFLWILYRAKEDGQVKLMGYHPWDLHADHGHDDEDEDDH